MRSEYRKRGFQEVVSPNMYNKSLWETSGHWQNYAENMFSFEVRSAREHPTRPSAKPMHILQPDTASRCMLCARVPCTLYCMLSGRWSTRPSASSR